MAVIEPARKEIQGVSCLPRRDKELLSDLLDDELRRLTRKANICKQFLEASTVMEKLERLYQDLKDAVDLTPVCEEPPKETKRKGKVANE